MYAGMRSCNATDKRRRGEVNRTKEIEVKSALEIIKMLGPSDLGLGNGNGKGNWDEIDIESFLEGSMLIASILFTLVCPK